MDQICIVEGNDSHVISSILKKRGFGFPNSFSEETIRDFYKKAKSVERIPTLFKAALENSVYNNIGIVLDANQIGPNRRYQAYKDILVAYDSKIEPPNVNNNGISITDSTGRKIGIWIMPDNKSSGYLEHFLERIIPTENKKKLEYVKEVVEKYNSKFNNAISDSEKQKAYVYSYLALQSKPGMPLGQAVTANYFNGKSS